MPHVEIKCYPGRSEEQKTKCAEEVTRRKTGKRRSVILRSTQKDSYFTKSPDIPADKKEQDQIADHVKGAVSLSIETVFLFVITDLYLK